MEKREPSYTVGGHLNWYSCYGEWASQMALVVKNSPANAGDIRDVGSIPELGRSHEGGHGNPLQYSFLENLMDREAWKATVHRIAKSPKRKQTKSSQNQNQLVLKTICPLERMSFKQEGNNLLM